MLSVGIRLGLNASTHIRCAWSAAIRAWLACSRACERQSPVQHCLLPRPPHLTMTVPVRIYSYYSRTTKLPYLSTTVATQSTTVLVLVLYSSTYQDLVLSRTLPGTPNSDS